ncbi:MAG: hypothetical protein ACE141_14520 [Bryobacteraceae bacterium]
MAQSDPLDRLLTELEQAKRDFGPSAVARIGRLLARLGRQRFHDTGSLIRFHEALLFFRAYPRSRDLLRQTDSLLASFGERVAALAAARVNLEPLEEPEVSGIAGSSFSAVFSYDVVRRLAELEPGRLRIDFDCFKADDRLAPAWRRLFPLVEEDLLVEAHVPYLEWLLKAAGGRARALELLLARLEELPGSPRGKADLWASLRLPIRWNLSGSKAARTAVSRAPRKIFYHTEPLIPRAEVSLEHELNSPPLEVRRLDPAGGRAFLNMALASSAARYRELHGFTYGDPARVLHAQAGRGVEIFFCGVPPEWRLPLRAYHAAMIFKNGVPTGYFETLSLFDRMEIGFNLYYTFREGETAWIFARVLRLFHQLLGTTSFSIDPYQIGLDNEEAIASGAFWFYRRLGFRPVLPEVVRVLAVEECKMLKDPAHRSSASALRKLAAGPLLFEMPGAPQGDWDRFRTRKLALAAGASEPAEAVARVSQTLGVRVGPHREFTDLALVLDQVPDLEDWPEADKKAIMGIVRARMGPDETAYLRLLRRHSRLREAVIKLGSD